MIKRFIYRETGAGGEGGPGLSLSDLDNVEEVAAKTEEEAAAEKEAQEAEAQKTAEEEAKKKEEEEAKRLAEEEADKDKGDEPKGDEEGEGIEDEETKEFLDALTALRGEELDVDYGDVDPLSPEGVILREQAVEDAAISKFEEYLEKTYPKAYGYLLHSMSGKPDDEYFSKASDLEAIPTEEEIEASVEVQKTVVLSDLIAKGNSEKHAGLIINQLIADNELEEAAKLAREAREEAKNQRLEAIKQENAREEQVYQAKVKEMNGYIDTVVSTGKLGNIDIPVKDRAAFAKHVKDNIRLDKEGFVIVSKLTNENVEEVFRKEFFSYKKGDIKDLVIKEAKTVNALRLRKTAAETKTPKGTKREATKATTLGEIDAE